LDCACVRACVRAYVRAYEILFLKLVIADVAALLRPVPVVPWGEASLVPVIKTDGRVWTRQLLMSRRLIP